VYQESYVQLIGTAVFRPSCRQPTPPATSIYSCVGRFSMRLITMPVDRFDLFDSRWYSCAPGLFSAAAHARAVRNHHGTDGRVPPPFYSFTFITQTKGAYLVDIGKVSRLVMVPEQHLFMMIDSFPVPFF